MIAGLARRISEGRFRISSQLYVGISGAVASTMIATLVAWYSFSRVGDAQQHVNEVVPNMEAAFGVAQRAGALVAAAPRLVATASPGELTTLSASIADERRLFAAQLNALGMGGGDHADIRASGTALIDNIAAIESSVAERLALAERGTTILTEVAALQDRLVRTLVPAIDDQLFYTMTGYRSLGAPPAAREDRLSEPEVDRYRQLADTYADATMAIQLLASAFDLADKARLDPLRDRFQATSERIARSLNALAETPLHDDLAPTLDRLRQLGLNPDGGIMLRIQELTLADAQAELLADNRRLVSELITQAQDLVSAAGQRAGMATGAATDAISTGRSLLIGLNAVSIVGAIMIAWLFVGRVLLRRLARLSERMRAMARGDLEGEVDIGGHDEVADMAAALEVFRRHALEVQRLNLVEKLANELREKNEELESTLTQLHRAQDQIVVREKLAALGELTAGVAHEIKNPLNFVKNFSEASQELVAELNEELADDAEGMDTEQQSLVREICDDLTENMTRIRHHGERADRIVRDMLKMGSDRGEKQPTDINGLLEEHARLAFHSARAADPDFQLEIEEDLDPAVGQVEVIPQDLGRVFLNMVGNACHATDARRRNEDADAGYNPKLRIVTKRFETRVEITIRDNGTGIPPDVIDKIFNPFFTTKPTDQGTGLGLALSNDIVRQHGGEIRVDSEPGSHTEMVVVIPL